ncbi:MATE family efflux transporter, partial [Nodularia spumigena]|uniref:hypothetical protein n=1 Tax=Nodularia spumigena TaxID=70799 RepID=UPI002B205365
MKASLFWNVISLGTEFLIGFVSLTLVSRLFNAEATGTWVLMLTILFLITKMREGMIQNALVKFSAVTNSTIASTARVRSLHFLVVFELAIAIIGFVSALIFPNHLISPFIQWIGLISFPQALYRFGLNLLQAQLKNREMAISNSVLFLGMMSSLGLLFFLNGSFNSLIFIYSVVFGLSSVLLFGFFLRNLLWEFNSESLPFSVFFHYIKHGFL